MNDQSETNPQNRPPRQTRKGVTSTGARKAASKSSRSRSREFALQALYQYLISGNSPSDIDVFTRDLTGFHKADAAHYDALLYGCVANASTLNALITPHLDRTMAERDEYDALIALGCIIRGETYHFELVANESGAGVTRVGLDYQIPIANAILTTENLEQAIARQTDKGVDAARVAVEMARLLEELQ